MLQRSCGKNIITLLIAFLAPKDVTASVISTYKQKKKLHYISNRKTKDSKNLKKKRREDSILLNILLWRILATRG